MTDPSPVTREEFEELKTEVESIDASIAHELEEHLRRITALEQELAQERARRSL